MNLPDHMRATERVREIPIPLSTKELLSIPRWARVVFAVRCVQRVRLLAYGHPIISDAERRTQWDYGIKSAILLAETNGLYTPDYKSLFDGVYGYSTPADAGVCAFIAGAQVNALVHRVAKSPSLKQFDFDSPLKLARYAAGEAWRYDRYDRHSENDLDVPSYPYYNLSSSAFGAAFATAALSDPEKAKREAYALAIDRHRAECAELAYHAAEQSIWAKPECLPFVRRDFELLRSKSQREGWTDATPVSPDVLGSLVPDETTWWVIPESVQPVSQEQAKQILAGSIRPEDYLIVPDEVMVALDTEISRFGDDRERQVSPAIKRRILNDWTLSFHFGGQPVACQLTEQGVIVFAVGTKQIKAFLERFPTLEVRPLIVLTTPEPWQLPNQPASQSR